MGYPPLPTITAGDFLAAMFERTGDRAQMERMGRDLEQRALARVLEAMDGEQDLDVAIPAAPFPPEDTRPGNPGHPLTAEQAAALFAELQGLDYVPFDYAQEGCLARAHEMCRVITERGYASGKLWNFSAPAPLLAGENEFGPLDWNQHVAPVVWVRGDDGQAREMVIDPSLGQGPMTREEWQGLQSGPEGQRLELTDAATYGYFLDADARLDPNVAAAELQFDDDFEVTQRMLEFVGIQRDLLRLGIPF